MRKQIVAAMTLVLTCLAVGAGTSIANARPTPAPHLATYGEDIWTTGDHAHCRGSIHVDVKTDPRQPGRVFATYRPGRFTGDGAAWRRNPVCTTRVWANWGVQLPGRNWSPPIKAGPRGGRAVTKTLVTGGGVQALGFGTGALPHKSVAYYLLVP